MANLPESNAVVENPVNQNAQLKVESAMLYKMNDLRCDTCFSLPIPPIYHCTMDHCLCSKCHTNQDIVENCKEDVPLCKLTTFLLTRMDMLCPNDKSNGCSTPLLIQDYTTHLQQCSHSPLQHPCRCPCCEYESVDIQTLKLHFEVHEPEEVALHVSKTFRLAQGENRLLKLQSEIFLLLKYKGDSISLHHMWWDQPRSHDLGAVHDSNPERVWGFTAGKTSDTLSNTFEQSLQLPLFTEEINVGVEIGASDAKAIAVLNLPELGDLANQPEDADVQVLVCLLCTRIATNPVAHCRLGHTMCLPCFRQKVKGQAARNQLKDPNSHLNCPYCEQKSIMMCKLGSYILETSKFYCPNRSIGCQHVMSIHEYESHVDECMKPFSCPVCGHPYEDLEQLRNHLPRHGAKRIEHRELTKFDMLRGQRLLRENFTNDNFVLVFKENSLSLQHMGWGQAQEYSLKFEDLGCTWSFTGRTVAVDKFPKVNAVECLKIPDTVLNPRSTLPVPVTLLIRHGP